MDMSVALIVFTADDRMLRRMDPATGPCLPVQGRPLASRHLQMYGDTFEEVEALSSALSGQPEASTFAATVRVAPGELRRLSPTFASALAALVSASTYEEQERSVLPVAERWHSSRSWPRGLELGGLALRVHDWAATLAEGLPKGRDGFCWRGPSVPVYDVTASK